MYRYDIANIGLHIPQSQWWDTFPVTIGNVFPIVLILIIFYQSNMISYKLLPHEFDYTLFLFYVYDL
jgi:hypothetical protein